MTTYKSRRHNAPNKEDVEQWQGVLGWLDEVSAARIQEIMFDEMSATYVTVKNGMGTDRLHSDIEKAINVEIIRGKIIGHNGVYISDGKANYCIDPNWPDEYVAHAT